MSLFEVPGWSVPNVPVHEARNARKRKRTGPEDPSSSSKVQSAVQNMEKLIATLKNEGAPRPPQKKKKNGKGGETTRSTSESHTVSVSSKPGGDALFRTKGKQPGRGVQQKLRDEPQARPPSTQSTSGHSAAKERQGPSVQDSSKIRSSSAVPSSPPKGKQKDAQGLTALQANMKNSLDGARFR